MAKRDREGRKDRYFALHHYMLNTDAWKALSAPARAVYIQIGFRYDGFNNGRIAFSVRDAAKECGLAKDTASRAFKELVDLGFIEETRHGGLSRKTRIASEWRMTAFKCDLTGALKSTLFMQRGAQARGHRLSRSRPQTGHREPARPPQNITAPVPNDVRECPKTRYSLSQTTVSQSSECPKRGPVEAVLVGSPVPNDGTHIVYQVGIGSETTLTGFPLAAHADAPTPSDVLPESRPAAPMAAFAWALPLADVFPPQSQTHVAAGLMLDRRAPTAAEILRGTLQ